MRREEGRGAGGSKARASATMEEDAENGDPVPMGGDTKEAAAAELLANEEPAATGDTLVEMQGTVTE